MNPTVVSSITMFYLAQNFSEIVSLCVLLLHVLSCLSDGPTALLGAIIFPHALSPIVSLPTHQLAATLVSPSLSLSDISLLDSSLTVSH
jgi:hypothetical protein